MPQRRNELTNQVRSEPLSYRAAFDANSNVEYEGWAVPGASEGSAIWIIARHTYSSNLLTATKWAQTTGSPPADFDQVWTNYSGLTYV